MEEVTEKDIVKRRTYCSIFILFFVVFFAEASNLFSDADMNILNTMKKKAPYSLRSHENYDFPICKDYEKARSSTYYLGCNEDQFVKEDSLSNLSGSTKKIQREIYKNHLLDDLQKYTQEHLYHKTREFDKLTRCFNYESSNRCGKLVEDIIESTRTDLIKMRQYLALKDKPIQSRSNVIKHKSYRTNIKHTISSMFSEDLKPIDDSEVPEIKEMIKDEVHDHRQEWLAENQAKYPQCILSIGDNLYKTINQTAMGKTQQNCVFIMKKMNMHAKQQLATKTREKYQNKYFKILERNPILAYLNLTGKEHHNEILDKYRDAFEKMKQDVERDFQRVRHLKGRNRLGLLKNKTLINDFIDKSGKNEILCDMMQSLKEDNNTDELTTDIGLGVAIVAAGITCGATLGLTCGLAASLGGELVAVGIAEGRYQRARSALSSGMNGAKEATEATSEKNLAYGLAPLAILGIDKGVKTARTANNLRRSNDLSPSEKVLINGKLRSKEYADRWQAVYDKRVNRKKAEFRSKTGQIHPPKNKQEVISRYLNFNMVDETLNQKWIDSAKANDADMYLDMDNSAMKRLNDTLGDKDYVTALTNMHKDILSRKMNALLDKYPGIDFEVYSDFKTIRYAFKSNIDPPPVPPIPKEFENEMATVFESANKEFSEMLENLEGIPSGESPSRWFQGGYGETADQAGNASKKSRVLDEDREKAQLTSYDEARTLIQQDVDDIKATGARLADKDHPLNQAGYTESLGDSGESVVTQPVMEILRKSNVAKSADVDQVIQEYAARGRKIDSSDARDIVNARALQAQLESSLGVKLSENQALEMIRYGNNLDGLTPGLWIAKRETANLRDAEFGGLSGDVTGMGAQNFIQVARDLARQRNVSSEEALTLLRNGEEEITATFKAIKEDFQKTVAEVLDQRNIRYDTPCSGDDCVVIPDRELSVADEQAILKAFMEKENPSQFRLSFIPRGLLPDDRTQLAVNGELVEKALRKRLVGTGPGKIPRERLDQITMGTRMPNQANQGAIQLVLGAGGDIPLSDNERELISSALKDAIEKVNHDLTKLAKDDEKARYNNFNFRAADKLDVVD